MQSVAKKRNVAFMAVAIASAIALAIVFLAGCSGEGAVKEGVKGSWKFESITPSEETMANLSDVQKADKESESQMLSVFMTDAVARFGDDGKFTFVFLGEPYEGTCKVSDGAMVVTMPEGDISSAAGTYKLEGDKLVFTADESAGRLAGFKVTYTKADDGAVEAAIQTAQQGAQSYPNDQPARGENAAGSASAASASATSADVSESSASSAAPAPDANASSASSAPAAAE